MISNYYSAVVADVTPPRRSTDTHACTDGTSRGFCVQFDDDVDVEEVYAMVAGVDPSTGIVDVTFIDAADYNETASTYFTPWTGETLYFCDQGTADCIIHMLVYDDKIADGRDLYMAPARLNGQDVFITVEFDENTEAVTVHGAWLGIVNGIPSKIVLPIEQGSTLQFYHLQVDINAGTESWGTGSPLTFTNGPEYVVAPLSTGGYYLFSWLRTMQETGRALRR